MAVREAWGTSIKQISKMKINHFFIKCAAACLCVRKTQEKQEVILFCDLRVHKSQ